MVEKYSVTKTFTEWYSDVYKHEWNEDYALLGIYTLEVTDRYEQWCKENNHNPIWNG